MFLQGSAGRRLAAACVMSILALGLCQPAEAAVTRSGILHATVSDDFRTGHSTTRYVLRSGQRKTVVLPTELAAEPGDRVEVSGRLRDGRLVGAVEATETSAEAVAAGPRKVAVILIAFEGGSSGPWSPEQARSEVFTATDSADAFYREESYGGISLTGKLRPDGDVFGLFRLDASTAGCPDAVWRQEADAAAAAAGVDLSGYDHRVYISPHQSECSWLGRAALFGNWSMINGNFFGTGGQVIVHELGHNLGLLHAGSWTCTSGGTRVQISDTCTPSEYGDPFDVMGNLGRRHSNGWNLAKLGILTPGNVETVEASGTYPIQSALNPTTEPTVLRIPRTRTFLGAVDSWYYLEVRQKGGVFENVTDFSTTGVSIRATAAGLSPETLLVDANPATAGFHDAPLGTGQTFEGGLVRVTTLAAGGGAATVSVELDEEPPTAPTDLVATAGAEEVQLQWSASSDNFGVQRYVVFRDGSQVGTSVGTSFLDSPVSVGDHEYVVYAEDESGNRSAASEPAMVTVEPDEDPPTAPTDLEATIGVEGVQLRWSASSDNFGVQRYVVFRDGSQVGTSANASFLDSLASVGVHEYVVYAEDKADNRSTASEPVTATVPEISGPACSDGSCRLAFRYSGSEAQWTVPPGVSQATFTVEGAEGGGGSSSLLFERGARVTATLGSLSSGEQVTVSVGGAGKTHAEGGAGGFGGGGDGVLGGGGGGYSSVEVGSTLMLLAGGGGGEGLNGFNSTSPAAPKGGRGGRGGESGTSGTAGMATEARGATLDRGNGGAMGGGGGTGGSGGGVTGTSTCPGGAVAGAPGAPGGSFAGGGGAPGAGGGGGGGYIGGGQGGGGAHDECGNAAGSGGGGGGSSYAAPGVSVTFGGALRPGDGLVAIAYPNPIEAGPRSYTTSPGQELVVDAAAGVLAGASGPSGALLTATLETPTSHGDLTLDADGSFTYTPPPGYAGLDSFAYRATDPSGHHATAQATIRVAAPPAASISMPLGGGTYPLGEVVPTAFSCSEGLGGPGLSACKDSTGAQTGSGGSGHLDTSALGKHVYAVTAVSKGGLTGSASIAYQVVSRPEPPKPPEDPPRAPEEGPSRGIDLSLRPQTKSLRELLRTGKLVVVVRVNKAAKVALSASGQLKTGRSRLLRPETIRFTDPGERKVLLLLLQGGRQALRHLLGLRLVIAGEATAPGESAKKRVALTLRR